MHFIKQFTILVTVCFIGEILHRLIPLPVPASIYGLVLMFAALQSKLIPIEAVEGVSVGNHAHFVHSFDRRTYFGMANSQATLAGPDFYRSWQLHRSFFRLWPCHSAGHSSHGKI